MPTLLTTMMKKTKNNININEITLNDLTVVSNENGTIKLKITGDNPTITYN